MKKNYFYVPVLLGALTLGTITSCVDDNESQSVTDVRTAKAAQLQALAAYSNAQAKALEITSVAEAALKNAQAEYEKNKTEEAKQRFALEIEKIKAQAEADIMAAKQQAAYYEQQLLANAQTQIKILYNSYSIASGELISLKESLLTENAQLAGFEAGIISGKAYIAYQSISYNNDIKKYESELAALSKYENVDKSALMAKAAEANRVYSLAAEQCENNEGTALGSQAKKVGKSESDLSTMTSAFNDVNTLFHSTIFDIKGSKSYSYYDYNNRLYTLSCSVNSYFINQTNKATAISNAKTAKTNADNALATAKTAKTNADKALATAKTTQTTKTAAFTTAEKALTDAKTAKTNADKALTDAKTAKTNADKALVEANKGTDAAAITAAQNAVTAAENAVTNATTAQNTAVTAQNTAQSKYDAAKSAKDVADNDVNAKTTTVNEKTDALTRAQATYDTAEASINAMNKSLSSLESDLEAYNSTVATFTKLIDENKSLYNKYDAANLKVNELLGEYLALQKLSNNTIDIAQEKASLNYNIANCKKHIAELNDVSNTNGSAYYEKCLAMAKAQISVLEGKIKAQESIVNKAKEALDAALAK